MLFKDVMLTHLCRNSPFSDVIGKTPGSVMTEHSSHSAMHIKMDLSAIWGMLCNL